MKRRIDQDDAPEGLKHNPFAALRKDAGAERPATESAAADVGSTASAEPGAQAGRVCVRREKRGRAGKTVTRVSGLEGDLDALQGLARELKKALGCGASVEDDCVLLQGALTERAAAWLERRLGAKVTIGN